MNTDITIGRFGFGKAIVLGAVGLLVALSGQAAERVMLGTRVASVSVSYADLNLSSTAGAQALYARIADAAEQVCGGEPRPESLREIAHYEQANFKSCYDRALADAVAKVDSARLYALHEERASKSTAS